MAKNAKKHSKKTGLPPGTLVHVGDRKIQAPQITVIDYDHDNFQEKQITDISECFPFKKSPTVTWINIDGIHDTQLIQKIGDGFDIHPLVLEDLLNTTQRPKIDDYEQYIFLVLKMLRFNDHAQQINIEQVSFILGPNFVISFQEEPGDVFENVRDRIRNAKGRIRKMGPDYLAYSLLDAVVDHYFVILEKMGENIESFEGDLVENPTQKTLQQIHSMKKQMMLLRRSVWPLREAISSLQRTESKLITKPTGIYLRDLYDHTIQVIDTIESFRDIVSGMLDIYLSSISNKMNAVMKVLTVIATLFIPLTFVAGVYGMNFKFMPELNWQLGYLFVWLVMLAIAGCMVYYFKRKNWW